MKKLISITNNSKVISVVGNVKNAGKTTVINAILSQIKYKNIAITSIGLDGEKIDQVTFLDKPRIYALEGYLIATASKTLDKFEAEYEIVKDTDIFTSIGYIKIIRITKAGNVLIAGPSTVKGLEKTISILKNFNLKNIFIDGAFSRHSLAKVADSTLFVVGANLSTDINRVVKDAELNFKKFMLKKVPNKLKFLSNMSNVCLINEQLETKEIPIKSLVCSSHKIFVEENKKYQLIYLPKSLTNNFAEKLIELRREYKLDIVVKSPVNIQLNLANINNLFKLKSNIYVLEPINLSAVFYNPTSPKGYQFDNFDFKRKLEKKLGVEVFNVVEGIRE